MATIGLFSILSIARDGIDVHSSALAVTSQNVAGVSTPGYVRRTAQITDSPTGVRVTGVTRSTDRFAAAQVAEQQGRLGAANARSTALERLESIVVPSTGTIGDRVDQLVEAFHSVAASPENMGARAAVLAKADALASSFAQASQGLDAMRADLFDQARDVVKDVNAKLERLSRLDRAATEARANGADPSPLLDQRDQMVREIAEKVGARVTTGEDGSLTMFGAGTVLYEGGHAASLSVSTTAGGDIVVTNDRDASATNLAPAIDTGTLGGLLEARDRDIVSTQQKLRSFAGDVASLVNGIHASGVGLDGAGGRNLLDPSGMALDPALAGHPERVAAAGAAGDLPGGNDVAVALAAAGEKPLASGGTMSERFASFAGEIGTTVATAQSEQQTREDTLASAEAVRESASGVSTDEEMIRMQQFQRGFEASMRVLSTVNDLFETLMRM